VAALHPHLEIMHRLWDAGARGDADALAELYAPDAVLRAHGHQSALAGEFKGIFEILDFLARAGEIVEELRSELIEIYTSESGAVMRYRTVATRGPRHLDLQYFFVFEIQAGRIVEATLIPADQRQSDAFWRMD
jgi:ketosteroid isomerase-like protein